MKQGFFMKTYSLLFGLTVIFLSGCVTRFDKIAAERRIDNVNLEKLQCSDATLKKPFKLGIFACLETVNSSDEYSKEWKWNQSDMKMISSYADSLVKEGYVSEYFFIAEENLSLQDMNAIFREADKRGANGVLTVRGIIKVNRYLNPVALLDPTIIGAMWFPGSNRDAVILAHLDFWNMKNREALISLKSDCTRKTSGPTFFIKTEEPVNDAKSETLRSLLIEFKKKCTGLK